MTFLPYRAHPSSSHPDSETYIQSCVQELSFFSLLAIIINLRAPSPLKTRCFTSTSMRCNKHQIIHASTRIGEHTHKHTHTHTQLLMPARIATYLRHCRYLPRRAAGAGSSRILPIYPSVGGTTAHLRRQHARASLLGSAVAQSTSFSPKHGRVVIGTNVFGSGGALGIFACPSLYNSKIKPKRIFKDEGG